MANTLAFPGIGDREKGVQVQPSVLEDSSNKNSDEIASEKDSDDPEETCKRKALAGLDDAKIEVKKRL